MGLAAAQNRMNKDRLAFVAVTLIGFLSLFMMMSRHVSRLENQIAELQAKSGIEPTIKAAPSHTHSDGDLEARIKALESSGGQLGQSSGGGGSAERFYYPPGKVDAEMIENDKFNVRTPTRAVVGSDGFMKHETEGLSMRYEPHITRQLWLQIHRLASDMICT